MSTNIYCRSALPVHDESRFLSTLADFSHSYDLSTLSDGLDGDTTNTQQCISTRHDPILPVVSQLGSPVSDSSALNHNDYPAFLSSFLTSHGSNEHDVDILHHDTTFSSKTQSYDLTAPCVEDSQPVLSSLSTLNGFLRDDVLPPHKISRNQKCEDNGGLEEDSATANVASQYSEETSKDHGSQSFTVSTESETRLPSSCNNHSGDTMQRMLGLEFAQTIADSSSQPIIDPDFSAILPSCESPWKGVPLSRVLELAQRMREQCRVGTLGQLPPFFLMTFIGRLDPNGEQQPSWRCYITGCDKKCIRRDHAMDHIRMHLNDRGWFCDLCSKAFLRSHDLKRHKDTHDSTKFWHCVPPCGRAFNRKDLLYRHMENSCPALKSTEANTKPALCRPKPQVKCTRLVRKEHPDKVERRNVRFGAGRPSPPLETLPGWILAFQMALQSLEDSKDELKIKKNARGKMVAT